MIEWTIQSFAEHSLKLIDERDKQYTQKFESLERAVTKAEAAAEKRFESVNEFRATLGDQQRLLMPRSEAESRFLSIDDTIEKMEKALADRLEKMEKSLTEIIGTRTGVGNGWGYAVGAVGIIIAIISLVFSFLK